MSLKNFLPLRREVREHWTYKDNDYFKLWIEILFCARYLEKPTTEIYRSQLYTLNQGEFLFGRKTFSERLNINEAKIRKFIELAIKEDMIKMVGRVGKQGATIYSVTNYNHYNCKPTETIENKGFEETLTNDSPTTHQRLTTKEESNKETIKDIVEYLNLKANKDYKYSTVKTKTLINARINDGYNINDFKAVIDIKSSQWINDNEWNKYLRPETLFGTKFEGYLNESKKPQASKLNIIQASTLKEYRP